MRFLIVLMIDTTCGCCLRQVIQEGVIEMSKSKRAERVVELSRRGAAAMAHTTAGRSAIVSPNKRAYDRKKGKSIFQT